MNWNADCWCGQEHIGGRWYEFQHLTMTEFRELSAGRFDAYSSFSVVRNPYTRLLSDYLWFQLHNPVNSSFEMFVRAIPADLDRNWQNYIAAANKQQANYFIHLRPQNHYITDGEGRSLVDNILRFEQLGQEFYEFSKLPESSGNSIKTPRARDINPYFDRPLIELTNRLYEKDFEMFSYPIL